MFCCCFSHRTACACSWSWVRSRFVILFAAVLPGCCCCQLQQSARSQGGSVGCSLHIASRPVEPGQIRQQSACIVACITAGKLLSTWQLNNAQTSGPSQRSMSQVTATLCMFVMQSFVAVQTHLPPPARLRYSPPCLLASCQNVIRTPKTCSRG